MKLLIVDDEVLTRNGLITSIDWEKFGINEIYEADDGVNGLKKAKEVEPDIVICDMRMPRMDGVEMMENIEKFLPNVTSVFMSGYTDRRYLKSAIALRAVNYIDKPIQKKEMEEAIKQAVEEQSRVRARANLDASERHQIASRLAYELTLPYQGNKEEVDSCFEKYTERYGPCKFDYVTTVVLRLKNPPIVLDSITDAAIKLRTYTQNLNLRMIFTEKRVSYIIFHFFGTKKHTDAIIDNITCKMSELFSDFGPMYITVGNTEEGISNACESYANAVLKLQNSFFFPVGSIIKKDPAQDWGKYKTEDADRLVSEFKSALNDKNETATLKVVNELHKLLDNNTKYLQNHIKNLYSVMFVELFEARKRNHLSSVSNFTDKEGILDAVDNGFSFGEMHKRLETETKSIFEDLGKSSNENATIRMIKDYIGAHYMDPALSVKTISEYISFSAPYACTVFKNATGITLNQYITDVRMKKAKQLLTDPRNKISDISALVGYYDGNYFGKLFKKYTDMSPSEYRELATDK